MKCPECSAALEEGATHCSSCGLILMREKAPPPRRRREDLSRHRRRASDHDRVECPFCKSEILRSAVRCGHCSEIVNEDYHREKLHRRRSQILYSSWVAYLLGLAAFLVFRPVGLFAIAAGMILSIVYYAIPADPSPPGEKPSFSRFWSTLRKQLKVETIPIPIPHFPKARLIFVGTPLIAAALGYFANFFILQQPMNRILASSPVFHGITVSTHYEYWIFPQILVFDLEKIDPAQSPLVVHTALLEYAQQMQGYRWSRIELQYHGNTRFSIKGADFSKLGAEYARSNISFVVFEFPRLVRPADGNAAPLPKDGKDAFIELYKRWYVNDLVARTTPGTKERRLALFSGHGPPLTPGNQESGIGDRGHAHTL
ncbi:MAG: zinc ribbon domain-containing protein [Thermoanaerobaculia bacterium]